METKKHSTLSGDIAYYVSRATEAAPWIVFLPGLTADHRLFAPQLANLSDEFNLIAWDAPRHGTSRPFSGTFQLDDAAKWLKEIIEKETTNALEQPTREATPNAATVAAAGKPRVILAGQSLGAYIAQVYLELFPDQIRGFISIDSAPLKRAYYKIWELAALKRTYWMYRVIPSRPLAA